MTIEAIQSNPTLQTSILLLAVVFVPSLAGHFGSHRLTSDTGIARQYGNWCLFKNGFNCNVVVVMVTLTRLRLILK